MRVQVEAVLTPAELQEIRAELGAAAWIDGRVTAGAQAQQVKNNLQLAEDHPLTATLRNKVLAALQRSTVFFAAAFPRQIYPPLFNRYEGAQNAYGAHVDSAMRTLPAPGTRMRADISATLFLSSPNEYAGGELVVEDSLGAQAFKLVAGNLLLYPADSVHSVRPVVQGQRLASVFWIESLVRSADQRRALWELDMSVQSLRQRHGQSPEVLALTSLYHNLLRMWAQT